MRGAAADTPHHITLTGKQIVQQRRHYLFFNIPKMQRRHFVRKRAQRIACDTQSVATGETKADLQATNRAALLERAFHTADAPDR